VEGVKMVAAAEDPRAVLACRGADRAQDYPESKQIMAKLTGKNQYLRKINISEVGSLCCVKHRGNIMYREEST
jgi:hypothetical protein